MEVKLTKNMILIAFGCLLMMIIGSGLYFHSKVTEMEAKMDFTKSQMVREIQTIKLALPSAPKQQIVQKRDINPYSTGKTSSSNILEPIVEETMTMESVNKQIDFHKEMMAEMLEPIAENSSVKELDIGTDDIIEDDISEPEHLTEEVELDVEEVEVEEVELDEESDDEDSEIFIDVADIEDDLEMMEDMNPILSEDEDSEVEIEDLPDNWDDIEEAAQEILNGKKGN